MNHPTLQQLQQDTLNLLNEAWDTPKGELAPGDGSTPILSTRETITKLLNEGASDFCRTCNPLPTWATCDIPPNVRSIPLALFQTPDGSLLWAVRIVRWQEGSDPRNDQYSLSRCTESAILLNYNTFAADKSGRPKHYFMDGPASIGLAPYPAVSGTLTVQGYAVPAPLVAVTDQATWLPPDLGRYLCYYAAGKLAEKNADDAALAARATIWLGEYNSCKADTIAKVRATDAALANYLFGSPGK